MTSIKQKVCKICQENLLTKFGTCVATVSLFKETYNKEFSSSVGGKPIILANLLQSIGIFAVHGFGDSLCKKCQKRRENPRNVLQAKKSLLDDKLPEQNSSHSIIDDKIRNLMNIPTDVCVERNLLPIVKVYRKACIYIKNSDNTNKNESYFFVIITITERVYIKKILSLHNL